MSRCSDSMRIEELGKEIEELCGNCDRPDKEELGKIILSSMTLGFNEGLKASSADRPQGEWIEHKGRTIVRDNNFIDFFPTEYECSNCGLRRVTYFINSPLSNYCPNCGARMKGADDE